MFQLYQVIPVEPHSSEFMDCSERTEELSVLRTHLTSSLGHVCPVETSHHLIHSWVTHIHIS